MIGLPDRALSKPCVLRVSVVVSPSSIAANSLSLSDASLDANHRSLRLPALRDRRTVMLDTTSSKLLAYVRTAPAGAAGVVVSLNISSKQPTLSLQVRLRA